MVEGNQEVVLGAIEALVVWVGVGAFKKFWPETWAKQPKVVRKWLVVVAAVIVAVVGGVIAGLSPWAVVSTGVMALLGGAGLRGMTKAPPISEEARKAEALAKVVGRKHALGRELIGVDKFLENPPPLTPPKEDK